MTLIQIHRRHLSPHATEADTIAFIAELQQEGWEAVYTEVEKPVWRFLDKDEESVFERDFERFHERYAPPFVYHIAYETEQGES